MIFAALTRRGEGRGGEGGGGGGGDEGRRGGRRGLYLQKLAAVRGLKGS